jgi:hypothetical protein
MTQIELTDDEIRIARDIGETRYRPSLSAVEAHEAGEEQRALELWEEEELRRDPGICGMRDRRPPWVQQQDEEMQREHTENYQWEEPTEPGVSGWVKNDDGSTAGGVTQGELQS